MRKKVIIIEVLRDLHDTLLQELNPEILSNDSVRSILFLLLGFGVMVFCIRTLKRAVQWWLGLILFIEVMYFIAFGTSVGNVLPFLKTVFKYDVFQMLAQLCVGTKVCDVVLYIRAFLQSVIVICVTVIWQFLCGLWNWVCTKTILPNVFRMN